MSFRKSFSARRICTPQEDEATQSFSVFGLPAIVHTECRQVTNIGGSAIQQVFVGFSFLNPSNWNLLADNIVIHAA